MLVAQEGEDARVANREKLDRAGSGGVRRVVFSNLRSVEAGLWLGWRMSAKVACRATRWSELLWRVRI